MYSIASIPLIYTCSFSPKSELIGFITFFAANIVACFFDMVLSFIAIFSQGQSTTVTRVSRLTSIVNLLRWIVAVIFPCVNYKRSLFNIRLKSSDECISAVNSIMFTNYSSSESWMSNNEPGLGTQLIIFSVQCFFWLIILILIEKGITIRLICRQCCCCCCDGDIDQQSSEIDEETGLPKQWSDSVC